MSQETESREDKSGSTEQENGYLSYEIEILDEYKKYENDESVYITSNAYDESKEWLDYYSYINRSLGEYLSSTVSEDAVKLALIIYRDSINVTIDGKEETINSSCYVGGFIFYNLSEADIDYSDAASQAYVLAHECGHHIQNIRGILSKNYGKMYKMIAKRDVVGANRLSIRQELQADYYAGNFCKYLNRYTKTSEDPYINVDDITHIIETTQNIGDDVLFGKNYNAEISDYGTSEQRKRWFWRGYNDTNSENEDIYSLGDEEL